MPRPSVVPLRPLVLALSLALTPPLLLATPANLPVAFHIAAQPLGSALNELARQAGLVLLADASLLQQRQAPAISGQLTPRDALRRLLAGSGLQAELRDGTITLKAAASSAATALSTLQVNGGSRAAGLLHDDDIALADQPYVKAGSRAVIDQQQIERFRGTSVADMFKGTPGVQVGDGRNSGAVDVNVRGMQGQGRVPVVIDGSQQAISVYRGYAGAADRSYLDPDLISRVTIEKGPSLSAQGAGAVGGLVQMDTLKAADVLLPGERVGVRLRGSLQSNTATPQASIKTPPRQQAPGLDGRAGAGSVALATRQDHYELVAAYAHREQGNYFAGKHGYNKLRVYNNWMNFGGTNPVVEAGVTTVYRPGEEVTNTANRSDSLLLKGTLRPDDDSALELAWRRYDSHYGEIMPSQILRNDSGYIMQWPGSHVLLDSYSARYQWAPAAQPLIRLKANVWHTDMQGDAMNGDVFRNPQQGKPQPGWDETDPAWLDARYRVKTAATRSGADISNSSLLRTAAGAFKLDYGVSLQRERTGPGKGMVVDLDDINHNRNVRSGQRDEHSAFFKLDWAANDWLSLELGGRYTRFASRDHNVQATAHHTEQRYRTIDVYQGEGDNEKYVGYLKWLPDANGEYSAATDPRQQAQTSLYLWGAQPAAFQPAQASRTEVNEYNEYSDILSTRYEYAPPFRRQDSGFAPLAGVTLQLGGGVSAYARYSEGLRMPSLMESTLGSSAPYLNPLAPERSKNREVGVSLLRDDWLTPGDKLRARLAYFDNRSDGYLTRRPFKGLPGMQNFTIANMDRYQIKGLELQTGYDNGAFFGELSATYHRQVEICDRQTADYFRAMHYDVYDEDSGTFHTVYPYTALGNCSPTGFSTAYVRNHVPPRLSANLTLGGRWLNDTLSAGTRVLYTSGPTAEQAASGRDWESYNGTANQVLTRPFTVVDLFASYQLTRHAKLELAVDNLTNRFYLDPLTLSLMPAPGRTYRAAFSARF